MTIGLGPKRDDRRRRVLRDERQDEVTRGDTSAATEGGPSGPRRKRRRYATSARRKCQPTVMDLIPRRWFSISVVCIGVIGIACLLSGWVWSALHPANEAQEQASAPLLNSAELASRSIVWFCSLLCLAGALISLQIYLVRRHRGDDYRGYYTIWLWTAGFCLVASFNVAVGLHRLLWAMAVQQISGKELAANSWSCELVLLLPFLLLAGRLVWEMWESHAKWGVALAALLALAGMLPRLWPSVSEVDRLALAQLAVLGVSVAFVTSFLVFARFTLLDAHGLIVPRQSRNRREEEKEAEATEAEKRSQKTSRRSRRKSESTVDTEEEAAPVLKAHRPEPEASETQPAATESQSKRQSRRKPEPQAAPEETADEQEMIHSLSKAKKKKLSKRQRPAATPGRLTQPLQGPGMIRNPRAAGWAGRAACDARLQACPIIKSVWVC